MLLYKTIDSTQKEAKRLIDSGFITVSDKFINNAILASSQYQGVTTKNNIKWFSPLGNLYLTVIINKSLLCPNHILFCCGLAVKEYILSICSNLDIKLKWPNDLLISSKKVSGMIAEAYKDYLIIGIGVNLVRYPKKTINFPATSVLQELLLQKFNKIDRKNLKIKTTADAILEKINYYINKLDKESFASIKQEWESYAYKIGEKIKLKNFDIEMYFLGISDNGAMLCKKDYTSTEITEIYSDEIILVNLNT
jgi:BirA family biotin operon repressor/biotin-[acetyl-CoA-carboxylase] ligase